MLSQMLKESNEIDNLPIPDQAIIYKLANKFESSSEFLFLNPEELQQLTGLGSKDSWTDFLKLQTTQNYVKGQMGFLAQISQRKTFASLVSMAIGGGQGAQQAAKQVQELSGIMNQQDTNRVIILHQIPRPVSKTEVI